MHKRTSTVCHKVEPLRYRECLSMSSSKGEDPGKRESTRVTKKDELEARTRIWITLIDGVGKLLRHGLTCAMICIVAWMIYLSINTMAGKSTDFRSAIDWAVKLNVSEAVAWIAAIVFGVGYYNRRQAFKKLAAEAGPRLEELERHVDAGRTSSGLAKTGDSPPGEE